jgi:hypothetical protein
MSLYVVVLIFPFTGTKSPIPNHEKQPETIIPLPPNFTVGTIHSGRGRSPIAVSFTPLQPTLPWLLIS